MSEEPEQHVSTRGGGVSEQRTPRGTKKMYVPPGVVEYGSISKLTQSKSGKGGDATGMKTTCL